MKAAATIGKNLKLLFRNRESAYTIIAGPILIILLVSFAFMGSSDDYALHVAIANGDLPLAERTVGTLTSRGYTVSVHPDVESCAETVKTGRSHACLAFHEGSVGEEAIPVTIYMDMSRVNIVYQILDDLDDEIDLQADAIRQQLSANAILRMQTAAQLVEESLNRTSALADAIDAAASELGEAKGALSGVPNATTNVTDLRLLKGYEQGLGQNVKTVRDHAFETFDEARKLINDLEQECDDCEDGIQERVDEMTKKFEEAETKILAISDDLTDTQVQEAKFLLESAILDIESIQQLLGNVSGAGVQIHTGIVNAADVTAMSKNEINAIETRLNYTAGFLRGERTQSDVLSTPIATSIVSVTASDDQLSFAYPYLLILVIMFIGVLLSSMLVVADKMSIAAFRTFTTPTSDMYHVLMAFLTAGWVLFIETIAILIASGIFVTQPLLLNPGSTLLIIAVAIMIFTFVGMIVCYLSSSQEASMITSISLASVLLFVSNLVLPVEGMTRFAQALSHVNPYIVLSELLKRSMLYGVSAGQVARELGVLFLAIVVLAVLAIVVQRSIRKRFFRETDALLGARRVAKPLLIFDRAIHNEAELLDLLDRLTRQEFESLAPGTIPEWIEREIRNPRLARQLRGKTKERMIIKLDAHLRKHGKRLR